MHKKKTGSINYNQEDIEQSHLKSFREVETMRIMLLVICMFALLTGCGTVETFENISDEVITPVSSVQYELKLTLPEGAAEPVMESGEGGELFCCENFWISTNILPGGDMERTLKEVTGLEKNALRGVQTMDGAYKRFECVWTAAGEGKEQVCRSVILDNGFNHYAVTASCDYDMAGVLPKDIQSVLDSVMLINTD